MAIFVAIALLAEALLESVWLTSRVSIVLAYDWASIALTMARAAVTVLQFTAANQLIARRPPARVFARAALLSGAVLITLEIGLGWQSTTIVPSQRWWVAGAYWVGATVMAAVL